MVTQEKIGKDVFNYTHGGNKKSIYKKDLVFRQKQCKRNRLKEKNRRKVNQLKRKKK